MMVTGPETDVMLPPLTETPLFKFVPLPPVPVTLIAPPDDPAVDAINVAESTRTPRLELDPAVPPPLPVMFMAPVDDDWIVVPATRTWTPKLPNCDVEDPFADPVPLIVMLPAPLEVIVEAP